MANHKCSDYGLIVWSWAFDGKTGDIVVVRRQQIVATEEVWTKSTGCLC